MASPYLKVECFVVNRIPEDQLSLMLNPEMPLHSLNIKEFGRCDSSIVQSMGEKFSTTLCEFVSLCDSSDLDSSLINLVANCKNLRHLVYHGEISHKTIIKISELIKADQRSMVCLEFKEKSIKVEDNGQDGEVDEDLAVARDKDSQELYIVGLRRWHIDVEERQKILNDMVNIVSQNLGCHWMPV